MATARLIDVACASGTLPPYLRYQSIQNKWLRSGPWCSYLLEMKKPGFAPGFSFPSLNLVYQECQEDIVYLCLFCVVCMVLGEVKNEGFAGFDGEGDLVGGFGGDSL